MTPGTYRTELSNISAYRNQQYANQLYYNPWAGMTYWNPFYWDMGFWGYGYWGLYGYPMLWGGFPCDPLDFLSPCYDLNLYGGASLNWFDTPWLFSTPLFGYGYYPSWYGGFGFYNTSFGNPFLLNSWGMPFGSYLSYPSTGLTPYSSTLLGPLSSSAATSATTSSSSTLGPFGLDTSSNSATASNGSGSAPNGPVTLVFTNGTTTRASKYWLAKGELDYVTTNGASKAVPLAKLDMNATMKANERNGVQFLAPKLEPAAQPPQH